MAQKIPLLRLTLLTFGGGLTGTAMMSQILFRGDKMYDNTRVPTGQAKGLMRDQLIHDVTMYSGPGGYAEAISNGTLLPKERETLIHEEAVASHKFYDKREKAHAAGEESNPLGQSFDYDYDGFESKDGHLSKNLTATKMQDAYTKMKDFRIIKALHSSFPGQTLFLEPETHAEINKEGLRTWLNKDPANAQKLLDQHEAIRQSPDPLTGKWALLAGDNFVHYPEHSVTEKDGVVTQVLIATTGDPHNLDGSATWTATADSVKPDLMLFSNIHSGQNLVPGMDTINDKGAPLIAKLLLDQFDYTYTSIIQKETTAQSKDRLWAADKMLYTKTWLIGHLSTLSMVPAMMRTFIGTNIDANVHRSITSFMDDPKQQLLDTTKDFMQDPATDTSKDMDVLSNEMAEKHPDLIEFDSRVSEVIDNLPDSVKNEVPQPELRSYINKHWLINSLIPTFGEHSIASTWRELVVTKSSVQLQQAILTTIDAEVTKRGLDIDTKENKLKDFQKDVVANAQKIINMEIEIAKDKKELKDAQDKRTKTSAELKDKEHVRDAKEKHLNERIDKMIGKGYK